VTWAWVLRNNCVPFATAYRALATLAAAGIVQRLAVDDCPTQFEMAPVTEHDHLGDFDGAEVLRIGI
jgi:Fur family ferric uptake transcriptional regulator